MSYAGRFWSQSDVATLSVANATHGTTYYIDGTNGNNSNNGLSLATAFKTISYAVGDGSRIRGGNVFKIRAGIYNERPQLAYVNPAIAGNIDENHRIIIGPYGDGEVVIDATDTYLLTWSNYNSNIYVADCNFMIGSNPASPRAVIMDDNFKIGRPKQSLAAVTADGNWYYDSGAHKIYVYTGGVDPVYRNILVTKEDLYNSEIAFNPYYNNYVTLYGLTIEGAPSHAILYAGEHFRMENCTVKFSGKNAFRVTAADLSKSSMDDVKLIKNHFYGNVLLNWPRGRYGDWGNVGWPATTSMANVVDGYWGGNIVHDNGGEGILPGGYPGNTVAEDNISYNNWSVNIYFETHKNSIMRRNLTYVSSVNASDLLTSEESALYLSYLSTGDQDYSGVVYPKLLRRLYPICLGTADEYQDTTGISDTNTIVDNIAVGCYYGIAHIAETSASGMKNYVIANNTVIMPTAAPPVGFNWVGIYIPNGTNTNTVVKNNIVTDTRTDSFLVQLGGGADETGINLDNNLYYNANSPTPFILGQYPSYQTLNFAGWKAATPVKDANSVFAAPLFAGGSDVYTASYYIPTTSSPALGIGAAISGLTTDYNNYTFQSPPAVGALELNSTYTSPALIPGSCGSSNGLALSSAPAVELCTAGTASAVTGTGPWSWSCAGSGGGSTASCSATKTQVISSKVARVKYGSNGKITGSLK